jgi:hypothetical protein
MINICSISDKNYLHYILSLYKSIRDTISVDFTFYMFCIDKESYDVLYSKNLENVKLISIDEVKESETYKQLSENTEYKPVSSENTYCWSLASFFQYYILDNYDIEDIFYVDADILFYNDIKDIHEIVSKKSIGIMLHRHNEVGCYVGAYNVGLIYFKNDDIGKNCLKWWRDVTIDPSNEWAKEYGTCGDQKYLELFGKLFGDENVCVIDEHIGHGAPWNLGLYTYLDSLLGGEILWKTIDHKGKTVDCGLDKTDRRQKIYFIHFSQFTPDYPNTRYRYDRGGAWIELNIYENQNVKKYYDNYFMKTLESLVELK